MADQYCSPIARIVPAQAWRELCGVDAEVAPCLLRPHTGHCCCESATLNATQTIHTYVSSLISRDPIALGTSRHSMSRLPSASSVTALHSCPCHSPGTRLTRRGCPRSFAHSIAMDAREILHLRRIKRGVLSWSTNLVSVLVCDTFYSNRRGARISSEEEALRCSEELQEMSASEFAGDPPALSASVCGLAGHCAGWSPL